MADEIRLKERISLYDLERVFSLYKEVANLEQEAVSLRKQSPLKSLKLLGRASDRVNDIIKQITLVKNPRRKHRKRLIQILQKIQVVDKEKKIDPVKDSQHKAQTMDSVASWVGVHINKTTYEIKTGFTSDEVLGYSNQIIKRNLEATMAAISAHNATTESIADLRRQIGKVAGDEKKIETNPFHKFFGVPH